MLSQYQPYYYIIPKQNTDTTRKTIKTVTVTIKIWNYNQDNSKYMSTTLCRVRPTLGRPHIDRVTLFRVYSVSVSASFLTLTMALRLSCRVQVAYALLEKKTLTESTRLNRLQVISHKDASRIFFFWGGLNKIFKIFVALEFIFKYLHTFK